MNNFIEDGSGNGYKAKVNSNLRLYTESVSRTQSQQSIIDGRGYSISTDTINLTSDNESGIFYLKYTGSLSFIIKEIIVIPRSSTGGSGAALIKIYKNPTTGTLISGGTAINANNRNFSSLVVLDGTILKGSEGSTVTDGTVLATASRSDFTDPINFDADIFVLGNANSIAVSFEPPTGNTSQDVIISVIGFEENMG